MINLDPTDLELVFGGTKATYTMLPFAAVSGPVSLHKARNPLELE